MNIQLLLLGSQVAITVGFLVYASWSDFKTREVRDLVWAIYAPIAIVLSLANLLLYDPSKLALFGLSVGFTVGLAFLLFYSGAFGGADSKALMCIAFSLPFAPVALFTPVLTNSLSPISKFVFPLTIFSNGVLFAAASCLYMVLHNFVWHKKNGEPLFAGTLAQESLWKKTLIMLTGYKVTIAKLKEKWHVFPMEDIDDAGENALNRKLVVIPSDEGRDGIVDRLSNAAQAGKIDKYVWATPGLPMLIFITLGLVVALLGGDLVWLLVRFILA
ncbi:MAG TPA: A24 family peptidase C-terminal domain-containing protein [Candidatus Limnocylindrales bacterium]|nr:A24 family peptidase C-terminal domain-containing protein [Candidatus Limnocylindrales bacterium]